MSTILIVDDSPLILSVVTLYLESAGHRVIASSSMGELEEKLIGLSPDLVLLDVQMPELFGDDAGVVLKEVYGIRCPVYLLSSVDEVELARRTRDAGLSGFISKNDGMEGLVLRVGSILQPGNAAASA